MAEAYLLAKLNSVEQTFNELTRRLGDPDIARDPPEFQRVAKMRSSLEEVVDTYANWRKTQQDLADRKSVV